MSIGLYKIIGQHQIIFRTRAMLLLDLWLRYLQSLVLLTGFQKFITASVFLNLFYACSICNEIIAIFSLQSFTNPLMDAPLLLLTAKAILVECEESWTVCQVLIEINLSS